MTALSHAWRLADGSPVACQDKLKVLEENAWEARAFLTDIFEDAALMEVDEADMRAFLHGLIDSLVSPKR
jgi:hypothetical protein